MNIEVRYAKREELDQVNKLRRMVNDLHVKGRPEHFRPGFGTELQDHLFNRFDSGCADVVVALCDHELSGFAMVDYVYKPLSPYNMDRYIYHVGEFGVSDRYRRMGVASALIAFMKKEAVQKGYSQIELDVWEFNDDAIKFYFNQGFTRVRQFLELDCIPENSLFKEHYALRSILPDDAERAAYIEAECFPPSEACTLPIMKERVAAASDCFIAAVDRSTMQIIGFINGLCTSEANLKDELFTDTGLHDPNGENIMICSVAVLPEYQRQGIARAMMAEFLRRQKLAGRKEAILTCVPGKISMYEKFGFTDRGESDSTWGGEKWHEMSCRLN